MKIFIANKPETLSILRPDVTVEAEYGETTVTGEIYTLAHHGKNSHNAPPCLSYRFHYKPSDNYTFGISHIDLDTLGGILYLSGMRDKAWFMRHDSFWEMVAEMDVRGPHKLSEITRSLELKRNSFERRTIDAWFAYMDTVERGYNRKKDGLKDITKYLIPILRVLTNIVDGDEKYMSIGRTYARHQKVINEGSLYRRGKYTILRVSKLYVSAYYETNDGKTYKAIVAYNPEKGNVTISSYNNDTFGKMTCSKIVKSLWGPLAGGHAGIAGSPRGKYLPFSEVERAFNTVENILTEKYDESDK